MVCTPVLSCTCSNLKLHQTLEVKNIFIQNIMSLLTFNPGLTLTGFRTTRPWMFFIINCQFLFYLFYIVSLPPLQSSIRCETIFQEAYHYNVWNERFLQTPLFKPWYPKPNQ